jgi:hypothetical protein
VGELGTSTCASAYLIFIGKENPASGTRIEHLIARSRHMDYLVRMYTHDPDPHQSGDMQSWFLFYKWMNEGEIHYDISEKDKELFYKDIKEGDRVWFFFADLLWILGYVEVLRVVEDPTRDCWEIWYDGTKCHKYSRPDDDEDPTPERLSVGTLIPPPHAEKWLEHCQ